MRWALLIVGVPLAAAAAWLARDPRVGAGGDHPGSSLSTAPAGMALARAWLADHGRAAALHRPPAALPADAVVFRLRPEEEPVAVEPGRAPQAVPPRAGWTLPLSPLDERFVRAGGRLVIGIAAPWAGLSVVPGPAPVRVLPLLPGVRRLEPPVARGLEAGRAGAFLLANSASVFACGERPALARVAIGAGDVWLLACPELLDNEHLDRADHLALLAALAGSRPAWFDETVHGLAAGPEPLALLREWGFGPLLAILALATAAWWWRRAAIPGPAQGETAAHAAEAVEGVDALAALVGRASSDAELLAAHRARLLARLARALAVPPAVAAQRFAAEAGEAPPRQPLPAALQRLQLAYDRTAHARP